MEVVQFILADDKERVSWNIRKLSGNTVSRNALKHQAKVNAIDSVNIIFISDIDIYTTFLNLPNVCVL